MQFEDLAYNYNAVDGKMLQNRLYGVNELGAVSTHTDDIEDQGTFVLTSNNGTPNDPTDDTNINVDNNYGYTEIGELLRDNAEDIEQIVWRVDSKIARIVRTTNSEKRSLEFE
jgi:hypothetical protein